MSTTSVRCPLCLQELILQGVTYHECPEDYPECDHHDLLWLQLSGGLIDEGDPVFRPRPSNELVFKIVRGAPEIVGHCFKIHDAVCGTCHCHRGLIADMADVEPYASMK